MAMLATSPITSLTISNSPATSAIPMPVIEAAMEKARQQKAQAAPRNTEVAAPEIQAEIAAIDARRESAAKATEATPPAPGA